MTDKRLGAIQGLARTPPPRRGICHWPARNRRGQARTRAFKREAWRDARATPVRVTNALGMLETVHAHAPLQGDDAP